MSYLGQANFDSMEAVVAAGLRGQQDLELAKETQARLFPRKPRQLETLNYAGVCIQAHEVGGDYYDFLDMGSGRFGLVVADVAGKGIAAALLMANLQAILRSQRALNRSGLADMLNLANGLFYENSPEHRYATLFFSEYEEDTRCLRYANCGHVAPILIHSDLSVERLVSTSTVLGIFEDWKCSTAQVQLVPGDTLILFTDGLTEGRNEEGEEFGEQRVLELLRTNRQLPVSILLKELAAAVAEFAPDQEDDMTLVAVRCV